MSSWNMSNDCCSWDGVTCDEMTGHVIELDFSCSQLVGKIDPNNSLFQLSHLKRHDHSYNNFSGSHISPQFGRLSSLTHLKLFQGPIPESLSNLTRFEYLVLDGNTLNGTILSWMFSQRPSLSYLVLGHNHFSASESHDMLLLAACVVKELEFLRSAKQLGELDLSNNKLQGRILDWARSNWMFSLPGLNLSHNMLTSVDSIPLQYVDTIDLRSNLLQSSLPIPPNSTRHFFILENNLSEEIPLSICNLTSLEMLDLGRNNLHGEIPRCLVNITALGVLDIRHNNLSGNLPRAFSNGYSLTSFNLHGNKLEGKVPRSLANCKELQVLDLGENHLIGTFPMWLGTLPKLRFNELHGSIRSPTIENIFPNLRLLDLSSNAFTENLPTSLFQRLKALRTIDPSKKESSYGYYQDTVAAVTKGLELEVVRIFFMGDLVVLPMLNLSHNGLEGQIPPSLGNLSCVESLDLSDNHLVGEIPVQFSSLTSLEVFNLSHNHLEGCIPQGPQFATFEKNSYEGNDGLHGIPVSKGYGNDHVSDTYLD
ncbi:hypothetical protein P3S68_032315 [Capsicum galapagoense]